MINLKFPNKMLYMFDTFESFDREEFEKEVNLKRVPDTFYETFKQTDENYVLSIMPYPDKCKICKGFFPKTTKGVEYENEIGVKLRKVPLADEGGTIVIVK